MQTKNCWIKLSLYYIAIFVTIQKFTNKLLILDRIISAQ